MLKTKGSKYDWVTIFIYIALVAIGWINIYSASFNEASTSFFDVKQVYTKQLMFICLSVLLIIFILAIEAKFYERFSSIIYLIALFSLLGLFLFGKNINGATSWYAVGGFTIQPSEFAKVATSLALAKYVSDIQIDLLTYQDQIKSLIIVFLPAILIIPQPDPGSALVYLALIFALYREGLPTIYLLFSFIVAALFVATLSFGTVWVSLLILLITGIIIFKSEKKSIFKYGILAVACIGFSISVNFIFENVLEQRHRDRFNIVLGKQVDTKSIGYNTNQSEIAIGSGGWTGKGWLQGTQTKGKFVPEQDTDYIFSTVGEEWGFIGSMGVVVLFLFLIIRLLILSERQKSQFSRIYGYSVASILFFHFFINIGMVSGLLPTIGIPLPFFSYGGSGLWGFTILLFIFIRLDASNYINH
ncbi:MAG: rod shape-determining protein RodA [Flavobacteriaceae bacterium]|nr:rod shape-determining protein RodA [Flavobacteriaceae bacterium]|tara:strand:- start:4707 stop:5954 length:1248 start_codon:yes stop_codon:yes gene_type:complete